MRVEMFRYYYLCYVLLLVESFLGGKWLWYVVIRRRWERVCGVLVMIYFLIWVLCVCLFYKILLSLFLICESLCVCYIFIFKKL